MDKDAETNGTLRELRLQGLQELRGRAWTAFNKINYLEDLFHTPDLPPRFSCKPSDSMRMPRSTALHMS